MALTNLAFSLTWKRLSQHCVSVNVPSRLRTRPRSTRSAVWLSWKPLSRRWEQRSQSCVRTTRLWNASSLLQRAQTLALTSSGRSWWATWQSDSNTWKSGQRLRESIGTEMTTHLPWPRTTRMLATQTWTCLHANLRAHSSCRRCLPRLDPYWRLTRPALRRNSAVVPFLRHRLPRHLLRE